MKYPITLLLVLATFLLFYSTTDAQDAKRMLHHYFSEIRAGHSGVVPEISEAFPIREAISIADEYTGDSVSDVRTKALELIYLLSRKASDRTVRRAGVDTLLEHYRAEGNTNTNSLIIAYLESYSSDDFSSSATERIMTLVKTESAYLGRWIRIAGFLNIVELRDYLRGWSQPGNPVAIRWSALLALTRLGDPAARMELVRRMSTLPVNDDVVYDVYPDLIYTRSQELFKLIVEALHDTRKNCRTADVEQEAQIPCGYRIMELLAPVVQDFPLNIDSSGDLVVSDYAQALAMTRKWFNENADYTIMTDKY